MRILERCSTAWPMPDMQQQIDALRQAFSADIRKPFVLKPSFPYGSPPATTKPTPNSQYRPRTQPSSMDQHNREQQQQTSQQQQQPVSYNTHPNHPISPPISAGGAKSDSPQAPQAVQSLVMMATGQRAPQQAMTNGIPMADSQGSWNPAKIFE